MIRERLGDWAKRRLGEEKRSRPDQFAQSPRRPVAPSLRRALCSALCALVSFGCGYALVGRANFLPVDVRTIQVPSFVNRTTRVELEQRVTQAVAEEMVSRGRLTLVNEPKEAHVILKGSIESFGLTPVEYNQEGTATRYQVSVAARIELVDHRNEDKVLWKNDQYLFTESYSINLQLADAFDQETRAIQEIAVRFAESVVANILEGF